MRNDAVPSVVEEPQQARGNPELIKGRADRAKSRASRKEECDLSTDAETSQTPADVAVQVGAPMLMNVTVAVQVDTLDLDSLWKKPEREVVQFKTEEQFTAWTGLGHFKMLEVIVKAVEMTPEAKMFAKWDISIENLVTLVFVKLKTNLSFRCISNMFGITPKTASKYFHTFVPILADVMRIAVPWMNKDNIANDLPYHFQQYPNVRAILDCTEIPIQRSNCLHCRIITYSHYKGRETAKYMVSITPGGVFNFISPGYVGKASDKFIFNACNILPLFEENDAVMVDKGFSIMKELVEHKLELIRPPMLFDGQLSKEEATSNVSIASARVHVERSIQRLKQFKILTERVDTTLLHLLDDFIIILAGTVNLSAPILSDNRFV